MGPSDTGYRGSLFFLSINFPNNYPFSPPRIRFKTRIFHTNINESGSISLNILEPGGSAWSAALIVRKCLHTIHSLLQDPNTGFPEATLLFETDRAGYYAQVQEWTQRYAMEHTTS
ncbi:hypothetical protein KAF25_010470 [Fusarium avenaceum]|uniref:UBC core domain-containing protein n=1 Tax=Fusarium avenaceum TaxID=40199 RepID=A0A9P7KM53_9HYPO|nr:hypothetical protein KAF25_010470 [Fusarium avenaceum]